MFDRSSNQLHLHVLAQHLEGAHLSLTTAPAHASDSAPAVADLLPVQAATNLYTPASCAPKGDQLYTPASCSPKGSQLVGPASCNSKGSQPATGSN